MSDHLNPLGQPIGFPLPDWTPPPRPPRTSMDGRFCRLDPLDPERHGRTLHSANQADGPGAMWTYLPYGPFSTLDSYLDWLRGSAGSDDPLFYTIVDHQKGALGLAAYLRIAPENGSIEVGHLAYAPNLQRTASATEAMYLMMKRAFELGYRRYEWKCDALNAKSRAAALRLGFKFEGIFQQATVYKGRNRDTAWYAVLDRDWPELERLFLAWLRPANFDEQGRQRQALRRS